jgi:PAS domain S-box-containing protein
MKSTQSTVLDDPLNRNLGATFFVRLWPPIICFLLFALNSFATAQPNAKNVLLFFHTPEPVVDPAYVALIESLVRARVPGPVNFYIEHMEATRAEDEDYQRDLTDSLRDTYRDRKLDLVMLSGHPALDLVLKHRNELFSGVPIVYFSVDTRKIAGRTWPGITGVTETQDVKAVVDLALRLHPDTDNIAIVTGKSDIETFWLGELHSELLHYRNKIKEIDLVDLPTEQILQRVDQLPPKTIVFFDLRPRVSIHPAIGVHDALAQTGQRLPTYCIFPYSCVGHGAVAGIESSGRDEVITLAASLAARILAGENVDNIPVVHPSGTQTLADWRQLHRWNIPESALPEDTRFYNRDRTLWERDRKYIIPGIALIVVQILLIAGLLLQRARQRKAQAILRESEKRFRVMADATPALVSMCDAQGKIAYLNDRWFAFTGADSGATHADTWIAHIHPDDVADVLDSFSHGLKDQQPFSTECRMRRSDGVYRWIFHVASPRVNGDGSFAGFITSAIDMTDQKLAQQALEKVNGQLIEAQEKERTRIARELHDDICQRLALLSMELDQVNRSPQQLSTAAKDNLTAIQKHCSEIAVDVQSLSHQLHSSKLDLLGIAAAIKGFCREVSEQYKVEIRFTESNVPRNLSRDISLCLFRVSQEALHNAVKYSGTTRYTVELTGMTKAVQLIVSDSGSGFDVEATKENRGLGLVSMQERVHLVYGTLSIESHPGKGTKILAAVPLVAEEGNSSMDRQDEDAGHIKVKQKDDRVLASTR